MTKKLLRALAGEAVWPPPVWLMRQAGRYLPEYRQVRAEAGSFIDLCTRPDLATEVTLQPLRRYGFDAAILFSDILMLPWALGQGLRFAEGEGPQLPPIRDAAGLAALDPARLPEAITPIIETVRRLAAQMGDTTLIGFAGSPFTVSCYMVEGRGSKEYEHVRMMAWREPELYGRIIDLVTEQTIVYLSAQIDAGAEAVMLFDSWSGVLAPSLFRAYVIEPTRRITAAIRARYPHVPVIGFPRLAGTMLGEYAAVTGVQGVGMDTSADPKRAAALVPEKVALQGNVDPLALVAGGAALEREADELLAAMRGRPFIFNLGHGIVPQTSPDHVAALVARVRAA
ncbi:Uroporphyrinogen decarboxylase [Rhodovastum atsumiense]|uniref:Uroporphyrinogen decarboxylase n=1 Tax=Rhodovastum atsumiense TaxID=504468 RepID=A0A5M6IKN8_9PROT|nr:uroporphyrinogen decarboxylase [Rhodovastum atsumiense]KAA5608820.1 uroporphyrinogen decarboxylase [Rhodovastum atsumiense]CAH2600831.1 Uroporphyrinogen decarboxylase [Rhodovastum atsumiense]